MWFGNLEFFGVCFLQGVKAVIMHFGFRGLNTIYGIKKERQSG
jgi:hypothetical protein